MKLFRVIFKCPTCKRAARVEMDESMLHRLGVTVYGPNHICIGCGRGLYCGKIVRGKFNAHKVCSSKCEGATGPNCECSCGGKNHGGAHAA